MNNIDHLLQQMTLEEKIGQMTQITIDMLHKGEPMRLELPPKVDEKKLDYIIREKMVGSILNVPSGSLPSREEWLELLAKIQGKAAETRLKIPILYGIDAIHGVNYCKGATLFPQPSSIAASFNTSLAEKIAATTAYECRASALPWNFSPALDVGRNPVWPRLWESFGEDVYLNKEMGVASIKGYQGEELSDPNKVAACLKHFIGYGHAMSGRDRTPAWIPDRYLREYYLPPYEAAINAGAATIMINSGEINGVPAHASYYLLTEILRGELGFEGVIVTDWMDIIFLHTRHRIAPNMKEAVRMAIEAGIDMSMVPFDTEFTDLLIELVQEGSISEDRIDSSVRRILSLKGELGLFDSTEVTLADYPDFGNQAAKDLSLASALESIVLLKNEEDLLPISKEAKILVCGPTADNMRALNGGWSGSWQGDMIEQTTKENLSILEAIKAQHKGEVLEYRIGVDFEKEIDLREAIWKADEVDYIVLCLGENSYCEYFGNINDLYIDDEQLNLALALIETGKPIILVLAEGRPRLINKFADKIPAILGSFYPGPWGGEAIASILFGEANPSGKLPFTYPKYPNALLTYDHKYTETRTMVNPRPDADMLYNSEAAEVLHYDPQFPFGHGLSYTKFEYSNLKLNKTVYHMNDVIELEVTVANTGNRAGKESVLLFMSDLYASITPSVKRLRAFQKIELESGANKTIQFSISTEELSFVGLDNEWILEEGNFKVEVGALEAVFEIQL